MFDEDLFESKLKNKNFLIEKLGKKLDFSKIKSKKQENKLYKKL